MYPLYKQRYFKQMKPCPGPDSGNKANRSPWSLCLPRLWGKKKSNVTSGTKAWAVDYLIKLIEVL